MRRNVSSMPCAVCCGGVPSDIGLCGCREGGSSLICDCGAVGVEEPGGGLLPSETGGVAHRAQGEFVEPLRIISKARYRLGIVPGVVSVDEYTADVVCDSGSETPNLRGDNRRSAGLGFDGY